MKKNRIFDTRGFMLIETLLVSLTISGILVYMYAQFTTINNSYQRLYQYNTPDSLYRVGAFKEFILNDDGAYNTINGYYSSMSHTSAKLITCEIVSNTASKKYCKELVDKIDADKIILTFDKFKKDNILSLLDSNSDEHAKLDKYLSSISNGTTYNKVRLIIMFNDGTIATALFKM